MGNPDGLFGDTGVWSLEKRISIGNIDDINGASLGGAATQDRPAEDNPLFPLLAGSVATIRSPTAEHFYFARWKPPDDKRSRCRVLRGDTRTSRQANYGTANRVDSSAFAATVRAPPEQPVRRGKRQRSRTDNMARWIESRPFGPLLPTPSTAPPRTAL